LRFRAQRPARYAGVEQITLICDHLNTPEVGVLQGVPA
jgi:hypothetical protein